MSKLTSSLRLRDAGLPTTCVGVRGCLATYGVNVEDAFRKGSGAACPCPRGARPADLLVEEPTKFELVINLKTAKTLDIGVPPELLARADEVIE